MSNEGVKIQVSGPVKQRVEGQVVTGKFHLVVFPSGKIWLHRFEGGGKEITPEQLDRVLGDLWEFGF